MDAANILVSPIFIEGDYCGPLKITTLQKIKLMELLKDYWWLVILVVAFLGCFVTINQGFIGVVTMFGKYRRILRPGLNFKLPFLEQIFKRVSIQNRSVELEFQAVTIDQANVYFKSMLLYSVQNENEETIQKVAFKFISDKDLMQALIRTVEGSIRAFVSTRPSSRSPPTLPRCATAPRARSTCRS